MRTFTKGIGSFVSASMTCPVIFPAEPENAAGTNRGKTIKKIPQLR
jgi:hypothetical protein